MKARISILMISASVTITSNMIFQASADDLGSIAGIWALDKAACKLTTPDYDDRLRIVASGKNGSVESDCRASSIRSGGSQVEFANACLSEGERIRARVSVTIVSPDRITWKEGKAPPTTYVRCESGAETRKIGQETTKTASSYETGSFMLSSHGYSATITSLTGADTNSATMTGRVTREDAKEECERNSPGGEGLKPKAMTKCVAATMSTETNKTYTASADCKRRTIASSFGDTFTIVGADESGNARILDAKKEDIGTATASGAPSIEAQFIKLCPETFERIKKKRK